MGERGFTLIELMVAIVILSILAAMAWPNVQDMLQRDRLNTQVMKVKSALREARSLSVQKGVYYGDAEETTPITGTTISGDRLYYGVVANPGSAADSPPPRLYLAFFVNQDNDFSSPPCVSCGELGGLRKIKLERGVAVGSSTNLDNNMIFFNKGGGVFGQAGTIWLEAGDRSRSVTVGNAGRITE